MIKADFLVLEKLITRKGLTKIASINTNIHQELNQKRPPSLEGAFLRPYISMSASQDGIYP
jgi:hypothetical protein